MNKRDLETPALVVDLDILERNIAAMAAFAKESGVALRPHTKTHKTPAIAHLQMAAGAAGICCATLGEAEVMAAAGLPDILITRPVVGGDKVDRACGLARHTRLAVVADDPANVDDLAAAADRAGVTLAVVMEVDVGLARCGVEPVSAQATALARRIAGHRSLRFAGLQGYEGHVVLNPDESQREAGARRANAAAAETAKMLEREGLPAPTVTGGGTGTHRVTGDARTSGYTEIQPGSYATMDASYSAVLGEKPFGPALGLLTACVSRSAPGRAVIDAGSSR
jgi:D-serine deaminase-like pyridoxal phosphate-dependent protein